MQKEKYRLFWRSYGAFILIFLQLFCSFIGFGIGFGIITILFITVPCGIKIINTNKFLWYFRQIAFITIGILNIIYFN